MTIYVRCPHCHDDVKAFRVARDCYEEDPTLSCDCELSDAEWIALIGSISTDEIAAAASDFYSAMAEAMA